MILNIEYKKLKETRNINNIKLLEGKNIQAVRGEGSRTPMGLKDPNPWRVTKEYHHYRSICWRGPSKSKSSWDARSLAAGS